MSNPYYQQPQGYPQAPAPAPVPVPPQYQPQQYAPPPPPAYAPQGPGPYGQPQGYYPPQQAQQYGYAPQGMNGPPAPPVVHGSMSAFDSQPTGGGGPGISFKDAPNGTTIVMTVKRDVRDSDVVQDRQPANQGGAPKTRKDGSPLWVLALPVFVAPSPTYPEGEATLWIRSGIRDALSEAYGGHLEPKAGDEITLTLTERKPVQNATIPKNVFRAQVLRNGQPVTGVPSAIAAPPVADPPVQQYAPPVQQEVPQAPQYQAPANPPAQAPQAPQPPAPAPSGPIAGLPPMDPAQAALLARLQGQA